MRRNGLDLELLERGAEELAAGPEASATRVRVRNRWKDAFTAEATAESLQVGPRSLPRGQAASVDLPQLFGGADGAPTPGELLLFAVTGCVMHQFVQLATMAAVDLEDLTITAEGALDLRGSLGMPGIEPGMARVTLHVEVAADAGEEVVAALLADATATSPVAGSLRGSVDVVASLAEDA
jgi:uncharacterized OsmC-like protein